MGTQKKKILWLELAGFVLTVVVGTAMHFGLELSGFGHRWAWLFPTNESPWEHLKLSFYPVVFWSLILYAILRRRRALQPSAPGSGTNNFWFARLLGAYVAIMITVVSWSLQHQLMGRSILAVDISMMYVGLLASALLCWRLLIAPPLRHPRGLSRCGITGLTIFLTSFMLFSYCVPISLLWMDRPNQCFGIIECHLLFNRHLPTHCLDPTTIPSLPGPFGFVPLVLVGSLLVVCFIAGRHRKSK